MTIRNGFTVIAIMTVLLLNGCQQPSLSSGESSPVQAAPEPAAKPAPAKPPVTLNAYTVSWTEECGVRQAFSAALGSIEQLGINQIPRSNVRGSSLEKVPIANYDTGDELSASLYAVATADISFQVKMLLLPPESTEITIIAASETQPRDILKKQSDYLKQKISERIAHPTLPDEQVILPKTMTFDGTPDGVYWVLSQWADKKGFKRVNTGNGDQYYRSLSCSSASGIRFFFGMRLVDSGTTRLDIKVSNYENKDEFTIMQSDLLEVLESIQSQPQTTRDSDSPASSQTAQSVSRSCFN